MSSAVKEYPSLQEAITSVYGDSVGILHLDSVSGGDINLAYRVTLSDGKTLFLKKNRAEGLDCFLREAEGLDAIRKTGAVSVPEVKGCGRDGDSAFLLMDHITSARPVRDYHEDLGRRLAAMHTADCSAYTGEGRFGFLSDNYIGTNVQQNRPEKSWISFFRERRLIPQIRQAEALFGPSERKRFERLLERLDELLTEPEKPALLHGDLWAGNHIAGPDGRAWLIDPAVYVGHPEADIAMTELFGGFSEAFYDGYYGGKQRPEGYQDRREIYNLYHLLNHLNLFGVTYYSAVIRILKRYA